MLIGPFLINKRISRVHEGPCLVGFVHTEYGKRNIFPHLIELKPFFTKSKINQNAFAPYLSLCPPVSFPSRLFLYPPSLYLPSWHFFILNPYPNFVTIKRERNYKVYFIGNNGRRP